MPATALSNNDVAFLAWKLDAKIPGCLGFAVYRKDSAGNETTLPAWVGFQGQSNAGWNAQATGVWPVQKFTWRDLAATRGETYTYRIVPMLGTSDHSDGLKRRVLDHQPGEDHRKTRRFFRLFQSGNSFDAIAGPPDSSRPRRRAELPEAHGPHRSACNFLTA